MNKNIIYSNFILNYVCLFTEIYIVNSILNIKFSQRIYVMVILIFSFYNYSFTFLMLFHFWFISSQQRIIYILSFVLFFFLNKFIPHREFILHHCLISEINFFLN